MTTASNTPPKLLIIGNGMAAGRLIDEIMKRNAARYAITVVGDEPQGSYNRIMLSPVLAGEHTQHSIIQKNAQWYQDNAITFVAGGRVLTFNSADKTVTLSTGEQLSYDQLVIATGSIPSNIPATNQHLNNIFTFRTLNDVSTIKKASRNAKHAIVVGGGLLGLEAAYGLAQHDVRVTLVHRSAGLLNRQLDTTAGGLLRNVMENSNIEFKLNTEIEAFHGDKKVSHVTLKNGEELPCDLAIIATGITPNILVTENTPIETQRAIVVDTYMRTSLTDVSALGECCEFNRETFGLVEPIWRQCVSLADRLVNNVFTPFTLQPVATKLKVSGVQLYSAGEVTTQPHQHDIIMQDPANNVYRKLIIENNAIVGIVLFGDTRDGQYYFDLMQLREPISHHLPHLIFGQLYVTPLSMNNTPKPSRDHADIQAA